MGGIKEGIPEEIFEQILKDEQEFGSGLGEAISIPALRSQGFWFWCLPDWVWNPHHCWVTSSVYDGDNIGATS